MSGAETPFYSLLSPYYDALFPLEPDILTFLEESGATAGARVADIACGSGLYAQSLLERGVDAWGVDGSSELIGVARRRSRRPDRFLVADMRDLKILDRLATDSKETTSVPSPAAAWDLLYCIGNSVVHLPSREAVWAFLRAAVQRLRAAPGDGRQNGVLVIQWVELTGLGPGETRNLPPVGDDAVTMHRSHTRIDEESVRFDVRLEVAPTADGTDGVIETSNRLLLLPGDAVLDYVRRLGVTGELLGGFSGEPVTPESWVRVMRVYARDCYR